jgi:thiol-disulfide isomerase/thioredoxin
MKRLVSLFLFMAAMIQAQIVQEVRMLMDSGSVSLAEKAITDFRRVHGDTPEAIFALSWIGRGKLNSDRVGAEATAAEVRRLALAKLKGRPLDADSELPLALGASIEVQAQALAAEGRRSEAVAFLKEEVQRWHATSMRARIQKNLNLLTLEGHPAPAIDVTRWTGEVKPVPLTELHGHPVLLFFWAHWCVDCKAEASVIQNLNKAFSGKGLKVVGPTMHYGYAAQGEDATREQETAWIEQTRQKYYARIGTMPVPISEEALRVYGVSTTPTIVLVDKHGVVRMYHPGRMSYEELAPKIEKLLAAG